jgi:transcriptional regulator GlxA family with amidase domain
MTKHAESAPTACILAMPESSGAVLYGLFEVLSAFSDGWTQVTGEESVCSAFDVKIVALSDQPFTCVGGVPVVPHASIKTIKEADVVIVTDLALDPTVDHRNTWAEYAPWLHMIRDQGGLLGSVCSGSLLLADCGFLNHTHAATHWGYVDNFRKYFPEVQIQPNRIFVPEMKNNLIITSGGMSSWEDLALYLIARFYGEATALKAAKLFLLGDRGEGQLLFAALGRPKRHNDEIIANSQQWIANQYAIQNPVKEMAEHSGLTTRTFKRRFKTATGYTPIEYVQILRVEESKQMLEATSESIEQIAAQVGYEDSTSFRRLFKRMTGTTPGRYRQRFQSLNRKVLLH